MVKKIYNFKQGFTLIELLVVISIIGVLAALLLANMVGIRQRAADTKTKNDMNQVKTALRLYYNDNQSYPSSSTACRNLSLSSYISSQVIPADCNYVAVSGNDTFKIWINLQNAGDPDIQKSQDTCGTISGEPSAYVVCTN